ncbi:dethiobiotin synthase [Methylomarinum sp. Ch1-1]|uniref:ATP-dependent dethiobiotin synthetase BioD n=1 Tax=Methylomarinum roseum TaxID=3067653 RepID=A0AAU7P120_9GAMM|nr:dethiobiotin synthase [Methylomarinum sp. Ch1-1]MDP4521340.1 dethiobiotin synthase [Methylomarinum sp. Ch1-1]
MNKQGFFITGTDTGVGKTWATVAMMKRLIRQGRRVAGMKPVAAGCEWLQGQWKNEDALLIQRHASVDLPYHQVNPYAYRLPVSPHLASNGAEIDIVLLHKVFTDMKQKADIVLVEGAGGWLSPLSHELDNAGLAKQLGLPVILVVAVRLGCINHGLLSWRAIQASGLDCVGWIAMCIDAEMAFADENIDFLRQRIEAPLLGVLPHDEQADFEQLSYSLQGF